MTTVELGNATIRYDDTGDGPAVLLLAPGGLRNSRAEMWANTPWNPVEALAGRYRVVAMDQRNTGTSFAPVTGADGWDTYMADQLALMDHLGIERFAVMGMCIGGAFIAKLLTIAPERVTAAVAMQPIGLDDNQAVFDGLFDAWRDDVRADHPEASDADWASMKANLFGGGSYLWSVPDDVVPSIGRPLLVLRGDDEFHPASTSERLAAEVPGAQLVQRWKDGEHVAACRAEVDRFLDAHAT
ncbi:MAG: alpha/beta hydrolase [Ilumatobacteraceae bacterium]